jgi:hypothetical protein
MIDTIYNFRYKAFGLRVESEIPLPELPEHNVHEELQAVVIRRADLLPLWQAKGKADDEMLIEDNQIIFQVPGAAIYCIRDGTTILVSPFADSDENGIRLFLLGTCMGLLLMQRKILPLHGSAVAINGKAYAILGHSGAGKSTLASTLLGQGYRLLSDDVIPVVLAGNSPLVIPSYPQQKLWQESLQQLGLSPAGCLPIYNRETKFAIPVAAQFHAEPLPLAGVFELVTTDGPASLKPISGLERFSTLLDHTYRGYLLPYMGLMQWHFMTLAKFVHRIGVYQLCRPAAGFSARVLASFMLEAIHKEEVTQ